MALLIHYANDITVFNCMLFCTVYYIPPGGFFQLSTSHTKMKIIKKLQNMWLLWVKAI